ncbi:MAG: hypothetical protein NC209_06880 [Alistipes sp.]|nr:hypothetical protein [Alistipes senegalensis]MCM1250849.1 hypothetical protein [Alistipes sp.]
MKKSPFRYLLLPLLSAAALPFACSERWQEPEVRTSDRSVFTLADARRAFEAFYASVPSTRADEPFDEERILDPCRIDPAWESGTCFPDDSLSMVCVPFAARYDYRVLQESGDGTFSLAPLPGRLVVLKDSEFDDIACWLYFQIQDARDGEPDAGFSGTALFAALSGCPVSVGRFDNGALVASASLFDDDRTEEENAELLAGLLPETLVARIRTRPATRGVNDNNPIEPVEIIGRAPIKLPERPTKPVFPDNPLKPPAFENWKILPDPDLGGHTDDDSDKEKSYPENPHIIMDEEVEDLKEMLDSLYNDCMGQQIINAIGTDVHVFYDSNRNYGRVKPIFSKNRDRVIYYEMAAGDKFSSIVLMEELMHIYQGFGTPAFGDAALNKEIEAKLTWYIYKVEHNVNRNVYSALGGVLGMNNFEALRQCIFSFDQDHRSFADSYLLVADALRDIKAYSDEKRYRFDPNNMDISNLLKLLENCVGEYNVK